MTLEELVDNLEFLDSWEERYSYIIEFGKKLSPMDEADKTEENLVPGCISQIWLASHYEKGPPAKLHFSADSDALIAKGLIAILLLMYSGHSPEEITKIDIDELFTKLDLSEHLTPNRRNGFQSMVHIIKTAAEKHVTAPSS